MLNASKLQIKILLEQDLEEDVQAQCTIYNDDYTYKDCSLGFIGKVYKKKLGCSPPWFTNHFHKVCSRNLRNFFSASNCDVSRLKFLDLKVQQWAQMFL